MGKSQRRKGRAFEQKIARILQKIWPEAKRGWQFRGGVESCDVMGTPYHIECSKGGESIWAKWEQAKRDSNKQTIEIKGAYNRKTPIVIKQRDREEPVVLISFNSWLNLEVLRTGVYEEFPDLMQSAVRNQYKKEFGNL